MTPEQAQVWTRYHKASELLADATDELTKANRDRRDGILGNTALYEQIAIGALAEYRAARAAVERLELIKALTIGHAAAWPLASALLVLRRTLCLSLPSSASALRPSRQRQFHVLRWAHGASARPGLTKDTP